MKFAVLFALVCVPIILVAQTETFDIITYQPPTGWKKQVTTDAVSFSKIDQTSGAWCQIGIYKSVVSSGSAEKDFSSEWKALIKPETYGSGATEPKSVATTTDGWTRSVGGNDFKWQGKDAQILLYNISGYGTMVSTVISNNTTKFNAEVYALLTSIQLKKPVTTDQPIESTPAVTSTPTSIPTNTSAVKVSDALSTNGIAMSTTNFDDGWVAQPFADYVKVSKQGTNVLLHYTIAVDDEMRQASNMAVSMWNRLLNSRYRAANLQVYKNEMYTYTNIWFVETEATEIATGKNVYVGLRVLVAGGIASPIEIVSPSATAFKQLFPDQTKIENMIGYNKFAVSASDLVGTWEESSSSSLNYYNTVTGNYAGTSTAASANKFTMKTGGNYESQHKGAHGQTGNMTFYDQTYTGMYTVTPWEITLTNRFKGKTDVYLSHYEAVRGGRVLCITDKVYSGMKYKLVKVK